MDIRRRRRARAGSCAAAIRGAGGLAPSENPHDKFETCACGRQFAVEVVEPMAREALAVADGTRAVRSAHLAHHFLADYSLIPGDCAGALPRYRRSLATAVELRDRSEIVAEVQGIAMAMAGCGESGRALQLAAAAAAEFDAPAIDLSGMPFGIALLDGYLGIARVALGEAVPNAAWQDGQHTRFEHAIMLALDTESSPVLAASLEKLARAAT